MEYATTVSHHRWMRAALALVVGTMLYNLVEAAIALRSGIVTDSVALVGFGLDSGIEIAAAAMLLWRLLVQWRGASAERLARTEGRVLRFVGWTLIALALYVTVQSVWSLLSASAPEPSAVGVGLAVASLLVMPAIAWGKLRAAAELQSAALRAEAKETLACSYLSFTLLLGLAANAAWGWWWADPLAALLMVPWLIQEGREGLQGGCSCHAG